MSRAPLFNEDAPLLNEDSSVLGLPENTTHILPKPNYLRFTTMAIVAQFGLASFALLIWGSLWSNPYIFFHWHPALMTLALVIFTQGILTLQPATTPLEKVEGRNRHALIQSLGLLSALFGVSAIAYNKYSHDKAHFTSPHSKFGIFVATYLVIQLVFGSLSVNAPNLFGGPAKAKAMWKYHRMSGYLVLMLAWATALYGVTTVQDMLPSWGVSAAIVFGGLVILGVGARIRPAKFGFKG
jgi:cytochrome b561